MLELDDIAEPALPSHEFHAAFAGRTDRCAHGRGVIDTAVRADAVQHRMLARRIESRADSRELHRRADESLAQALAVRREILTVPIGIDVTHGAIFATVIDELRGENIADAQRHAVLENF